MFWRYFTAPEPDDFSRDLRDGRAALPANMASGTKLGADSAPLKLVSFLDFQCPFCLKFAATQEPTLVREYVETGKMQIIYRSLIRLGEESTQAAIAGECAADQNKFWEYHNALYLAQADAGQWGNEKVNVGRFSPANLKNIAVQVGLGRAAFDSCLDNKTPANRLTDDQREANASGIGSTPGFVLNGQSLGVGAPASLDKWREILNQALAKAQTR
jgi:protein-disulfide isomerase